MSRRISLFLLMLITAVVPLCAGFWDGVKTSFVNTAKQMPPSIDVLVVNDEPSVMLEVKGKYFIFDPNTKQNMGKRHLGKKKMLQSASGGLRWGEEFPGIFQLHILPETSNGTVSIDGIEYRGSIFVYDIGGTISIVNRVPIEEYLASTLPNEYRDPMPEETHAAVAISERTNVYYHAKHPTNKYWAVDANEVGYRGLESKRNSSEMEHAIAATSHMVLSNTGTYEGVVTTFPAAWSVVVAEQSGDVPAVHSRISLLEAEDMGKSGKHAAQILSKAFPGSHIELIH